jgi:hypothetical protein
MDYYITSGDQSFYRAYYQGIQSMDFMEGYYFLKVRLGASEPIYHIIMYFSANILGMERIITIVIANTLLTYTLISWLMKRSFPIFLLPLIALNFYLIVFLFSAERLKFSLILFMFAWSMKGSFRYGVLLLSVLCHFQMFIIFSSSISPHLLQLLRFLRGKVNRKGVVGMLLIIFLLIFFILYSDAILSKLFHYSTDDDVSRFLNGLMKNSIYLFFSLLLFWKKRNLIFLSFLPILLAAMIVGGERLVFFSFFLFFFYCIIEKRVLNVFLILNLVYFSVKGFIFLNDIVIFGDGFKQSVMASPLQ